MFSVRYGLDLIHWRGTLSLVLREGRRLGVCEVRMLRKIFGPKRDEVTGGWKLWQNGELPDQQACT
jgi:hypothetical protein